MDQVLGFTWLLADSSGVSNRGADGNRGVFLVAWLIFTLVALRARVFLAY